MRRPCAAECSAAPPRPQMAATTRASRTVPNAHERVIGVGEAVRYLRPGSKADVLSERKMEIAGRWPKSDPASGPVLLRIGPAKLQSCILSEADVGGHILAVSTLGMERNSRSVRRS